MLIDDIEKIKVYVVMIEVVRIILKNVLVMVGVSVFELM